MSAVHTRSGWTAIGLALATWTAACPPPRSPETRTWVGPGDGEGTADAARPGVADAPALPPGREANDAGVARPATADTPADAGAAPAPGATDAVEPLPPPLAVEPPPTCADSGALLLVGAGSATVSCDDGFLNCSGRIPIRVQNCGPGVLELRSFDVVAPNQTVMTMTFAPGTMLHPGDSLERDGFVTRAGEYRVLVHAAAHDGTPVDVAPAVAVVTNPDYDAARAACDACHGTWGSWGMAQHQACNCATSDAGKACRDGADCEGSCLFDRFEEVAPGMGVPVGHCAEVRMLFGCHPIIREGAAADPPQHLPGRAPMICID